MVFYFRPSVCVTYVDLHALMLGIVCGPCESVLPPGGIWVVVWLEGAGARGGLWIRLCTPMLLGWLCWLCWAEQSWCWGGSHTEETGGPNPLLGPRGGFGG